MKSVRAGLLHGGMPKCCPFCGAGSPPEATRAPCRHLAWFEVAGSDASPQYPSVGPRWDEDGVRNTIRGLARAALTAKSADAGMKSAPSVVGFSPSVAEFHTQDVIPRIEQRTPGRFARLAAAVALFWRFLLRLPCPSRRRDEPNESAPDRHRI